MAWPPSNVDDLNLLVAERVEERQDLEFKRQLPPSGQNDEVAKDICAMANVGGGILIYGIVEEGGRARSLLPFDTRMAAERLAQVARSIDEAIALSTTTIRPSEASEGFLVVSVSASHRRPHFFKGTAWARSDRHTYPMSRRQVGELFARQEGFAQEFGLVATRQGRVRITAGKEPQHGASGHDYFLDLENDGEQDVSRVDCSWDETSRPPVFVGEGPFPIERIAHAASVRLRVTQVQTSRTYSFIVRWTDARGDLREERWPVRWA